MLESPSIENKKEVPQINPDTGISFDYSNQFSFLIGWFNYKGIDRVKKQLKEHPFWMENYEEVYAGCDDIVNDKNRTSVKRMNELAAHMNEILNGDNLDEDDFRRTCNELMFLIYGNHSNDI